MRTLRFSPSAASSRFSAQPERTFGLKVHQFRKFVGLPLQAPGSFEIALAIHPEHASHALLVESGAFAELKRKTG